MSRPYVLSPPDEAFVERRVANGRYASIDDVIREGLRLLQERESAPALDLETLRRLWREGVESGDLCRPMTSSIDWTRNMRLWRGAGLFEACCPVSPRGRPLLNSSAPLRGKFLR